VLSSAVGGGGGGGSGVGHPTSPSDSLSHAFDNPAVAAQLLAAVGARASLADIPGLVEGAHSNRGLGHAFLRHVERCAALILVIDLGGTAASIAAPAEDAAAAGAALLHPRPPTAARQLRTLRAELAAYSASLASRPMLVVGAKLDAAGARRALAGLARAAAASGLPPPLGVSAHSGEGIEALRRAVLRLAREGRMVETAAMDG